MSSENDPSPDSKSGKFTQKQIALLAILVVFIWSGAIAGRAWIDSRGFRLKEPAPWTPSPGDNIVIGDRYQDLFLYVVFADVEAFQRWSELDRANDMVGLAHLDDSGRTASVPGGVEGRVIKLDEETGLVEVRIMSGRYFGTSGFVRRKDISSR